MFCILYFCAAGFAAVCLRHQWGLTAPADVLSSICLAAQWRGYHGPKFHYLCLICDTR